MVPQSAGATKPKFYPALVNSMQYKTGSKLEKHQAYVLALEQKIAKLEKQKVQIEKELADAQLQLSINKDYIPTEE